MSRWSWRFPAAVVSGAALLVAAHRLDVDKAVLYWALTQVDHHPVRVALATFVAVFVWAAVPRRPLRALAAVVTQNTLVFVAGVFAILSGMAAFALVVRVGGPARGAALSASDVASGVQSGVLVAGVIAAAVGFWFNDQRRRRENDTLRHDRERLDRDKERVEEERFIRTVELTGHDSAGVRIGALHSLFGLAKENENRLETVVEVLCSYLRQPFDYEAATSAAEAVKAATKASRDAEVSHDRLKREHQVRQVAQKLLFKLLPAKEGIPGPLVPTRLVHLDLRGAELDEVDVCGKNFSLDASKAKVHGSIRIVDCCVSGLLHLDGSKVSGGFLTSRSEISDLSASGALISVAHLEQTVIVGLLDLSFAVSARLSPNIAIRLIHCEIEHVLLPRSVDELELAHTVVEGGHFLSVKVCKRFALRSCIFGSPLDMESLELPVGQGQVVIPETDLVDLHPPRGWRLVADGVLAPKLVREDVPALR